MLENQGRWIVLVVAVALASSARAQLPLGQKPAAVVDGVAITMDEVQAILNRAGPKPTPPTELQKLQMQWEAVGMLIDDQLLQSFLRKYGPKVEMQEVAKKARELEEGLKKQGKTMADFYKETGQSEAQLRANIFNMLQWAGYVQQHLTDADLKRYYDDSKDFFDRVMIRASHIVVRVSPTASEAEKQAARAKLLALRQDVLTGKIDFAEAAKKNSQCTSAPQGGDIGYFPRKMAVEEGFARAAFALRPGELSDVVQTDFGFHLIKVTDRKPPQPSDFVKIKEDVREICIEEMRQGILTQQRKTAKVEINLAVPPQQ